MSIACREIYTNALVHIGEVGKTSFTSDYEDRAPYILASFCSLAKNTDKKIRKAQGLQNQVNFSPVFLSLDSTFPLCDDLCPVASLYIAAMLVIDEDAELSDTLYDKYCDGIASIAAEYDTAQDDTTDYRASCESIEEKYFFDN